MKTNSIAVSVPPVNPLTPLHGKQLKPGKLRSFDNTGKIFSELFPLTETMLLLAERERQLIARELHDNVNQVLSCANLFFDQARPEDETRRIYHERGRQLLQQAINEIRKYSHQIIQSAVTGKSLPAAVRELTRDFEQGSGIRIELNISLSGRTIAKSKAIMIYRILQEQLKNILVHTQATVVCVNLHVDSKQIAFSISDNGRGASSLNFTSGIGLQNIRDRVNVFQGHCHINTCPGNGFEIDIKIPRYRRC